MIKIGLRLIMGLAILATLFISLFLLLLKRPLILTVSSQPVHIAPNPKRLRAHVEALSNQFHPRSWLDIENLDRTADYIKKNLEETGATVDVQEFEAEKRKYRNIAVHFGSQVEPRIVIGAHYDSHEGTPGADDNASGVAGVIELARLISEKAVGVPVTLAAFTLEEPPFFRSPSMGSAVFAKSLKDSSVPVRLMISLEMIGYFSDKPHSQLFPAPLLSFIYPTTGNFIAIVDRFNLRSETASIKRAFRESTILPAESINAPRFIPGIDFSDHLSFWNAGFDAVMITDTAFLRNHAYHGSDDTADRLDYERMAEVVKGVYAYLLSQSSRQQKDYQSDR
ncbi:MAG: M28 family peptidase [Deltaproteobacteria bacterium]|nr:M28 family peptidase [Deltaproteobacteria bacterium]